MGSGKVELRVIERRREDGRMCMARIDVGFLRHSIVFVPAQSAVDVVVVVPYVFV